MKELRIFDRWTENDKLLTPLAVLLQLLAKVCPERIRNRWTIFRGASGYGERVCEIEDALEASDSIVVDSEEMLHLLCAGSQYFNHARIRVDASNTEFGVHDSTFLFVRGNEETLQDLKGTFRETELVEV